MPGMPVLIKGGPRHVLAVEQRGLQLTSATGCGSTAPGVVVSGPAAWPGAAHILRRTLQMEVGVLGSPLEVVALVSKQRYMQLHGNRYMQLC
jgi:hypothetical protein